MDAVLAEEVLAAGTLAGEALTADVLAVDTLPDVLPPDDLVAGALTLLLAVEALPVTFFARVNVFPVAALAVAGLRDTDVP